MRSVPPSLTLLVPGLLGPFGTVEPPRLPALEWLLARADVAALKAPPGLDAHLFCLFEVQNGGADHPCGAVCRRSDGFDADDHYWFRAAPVHLLAHQDRVYLMGHEELAVSASESAALVAEINAHFAEDGWVLEAPTPDRWYLRVPGEPAVHTTPLHDALGCDIHPLLPDGPDAARWRARINEMQMLLHASPVNADREARGAPVINSLWIWGGGRSPGGATSRFRAVFSNECVALGLACIATVEAAPLPVDLSGLLAQAYGPGRLLAVDDRLRRRLPAEEPGKFQQALGTLEERWFAPAREALTRGTLSSVEIMAADGRSFRISRRACRRFWRRRRPLTALSPA